MPLSALFIIGPCQISNAALRAWLASGNTIAEIWNCEVKNNATKSHAHLTKILFPQFNTLEIIRRYKLNYRLCPPLKKWEQANDVALKLKADVLITSMTYVIVPQTFLEIFGNRAVNIHPAILPFYRGPSPFLGMLLDGTADLYGGVTLHVLTEGIDEGPIIGQRHCPRSEAKNFFDWEHRLAKATADLVTKDLIDFLEGIKNPVDQRGMGNYRRVKRSEIEIGTSSSLAEVRRIFDQVGKGFKIFWADQKSSPPEETFEVTSIRRVLGPPSREDPHIGPFVIEADIKDARVHFNRKSGFSRLARSWAKFQANWQHRRDY